MFSVSKIAMTLAVLDAADISDVANATPLPIFGRHAISTSTLSQQSHRRHPIPATKEDHYVLELGGHFESFSGSDFGSVPPRNL